ncbi:MAG: hypothetical protein CVV24_14415, partial [Ignavibacteriae bacterium HGW-Ignavibacteriae-3]
MYFIPTYGNIIPYQDIDMKAFKNLTAVSLFLFFCCSLSSIQGNKPGNHIDMPEKIDNSSTKEFNCGNDLCEREQNGLREYHSRSDFMEHLRKILGESKQILIAVSKEWDDAEAVLNYYERLNGKMIRVSDDVPVELGRSGMGWGSGILDFYTENGPIKHEGDGRSPAGIFNMSYAFGYLPKDSLSWLKYPYKQLTDDIECVDDTSSRYYNTLVSTSTINKTWNSSEKMRSSGIHYKYGIFIEHNSNPPKSGCGSCIFIHVSS